MSHEYSIRTRSAVIIAVSFALFLSLFSLLSYLSTKSALIARSEGEARNQLRSIFERLENGTTPESLPELITQHNRIGESALWFAIYSWDSTINGELTPIYSSSELPFDESDIRKLAHDPSVSATFVRANNTWRLVGLSDRHYCAIATMSMHVIDETREAMLQQFGIMLVLGILFSILLGFVLAEFSLAPIRTLIEATRKLQSSHHTRIPTNDGMRRLPVPEGITEVAVLVTALNSLIDDREASIAQLRDFTADAAHELRTPLTVLKGEIEVELKFVAQTNPSHAILQSNLEEVERLIALVEDLLTLSKLEQNDTTEVIEQQPVHVAELIDHAVDRLETFAQSKHVSITVEAASNPLMMLNRDRCERMFYNIIHNAISYTDTGGRIGVSIKQNEDACIVAVSDNGIGIAPKDLPHIFDRFYRADKSRARTAGGAGLGLAIAKSIAQKSRFTISAESVVSRGTVVRVSMPIDAVE